MGARETPRHGTAKGNFVTEWFGHRVWPTVDDSREATLNQPGRACPFLTDATSSATLCIKIPRIGGEPTGVCTISSDSNGKREDWLACPYRTLDKEFTLFQEAIRLTYGIADNQKLLVVPVTILTDPKHRDRVANAIADHKTRVFAFAADKLGGEVDLPETVASPGAKVDASVVELLKINPGSRQPDRFGRHLFYEIQTADFHGSPLHAVRLLQHDCPLGTPAKYHDTIAQHVEICGTGVEGPNKANVFKRTIYQMLLKIQMTEHPLCAGFAIILPEPVWNSWLKHLGRPELVQAQNDPKTFLLAGQGLDASIETARSWVLVFDIDRESSESPQPLVVTRRIAVSAQSIMHHAFDLAARQAIEKGVIDRYRSVLEARVLESWNQDR